MLPNVTVTPAAEKFMRRMVRFSGMAEGAGFRLEVSAGGCSGYDAKFDIQPAPLAGDEVLDVNGLKVFLPATSRLLLDGVTVDFADTPSSSGLSFFNPTAAPCGCSSSGASAMPPGVATVSLDSLRRH
ncbi:MAG: iron-sulfur cluster assembly accessory protein [Zoogloea sp.]|nr:iron-sulfur cluster assembly accessory protein [Zoogloea sp.]